MHIGMHEKYYFIGGLNIGNFVYLPKFTCQYIHHVCMVFKINISFMPSKRVSMLIGCMTLLYDVYQKYVCIVKDNVNALYIPPQLLVCLNK